MELSGAGNKIVNGSMMYREKIHLLTDAAGTSAISGHSGTLTVGESGTHFIVPALTSGAQFLTLPSMTGSLGVWYKFTMLGTAAQVFSVKTPTAGHKVILWEPDGDGTGTKNTFNDMTFLAAALVGASFKITCISETAATAWLVTDIVKGLAAGTGEHQGA